MRQWPSGAKVAATGRNSKAHDTDEAGAGRFSRASAGVAEVVTLFVMAHEVHAAGGLRIAHDARCLHPFARPKLHEQMPPVVLSDAAEVSHAGPGTRRRNGRVAGVAAKALQVQRGVLLRLVEFEHGLAKGDHVQRFLGGCAHRTMTARIGFNGDLLHGI